MAYPTSERIVPHEVMAHHSRPLEPRDIINIDLTIFYQGYHGDTSRTYCLPDVDGQGSELVEATQEALNIGLRACGPGMPLNGIGQAIEFVTAGRGGVAAHSQGVRKERGLFCQFAILGPWYRSFLPSEAVDFAPSYADLFTAG